MLYLILLLIALELVNIHVVLGKNTSEYQQYLRSVPSAQETQLCCANSESCSLLLVIFLVIFSTPQSGPELFFSVDFSANL